MAEQKIGTANIEIGVKSTVPQDLEASKKSLKDFASTTKQASQEVEKSMADASSAVAKMETTSDNLSRAQKRTADSIIRSSERLSAGSKAAYLDWVAAQAGVTNATQAARDKLRQWENQQSESVSAGRKYIQMLKEQTETLGMNRRELMQYQAAQLGVSDQAAPLINKMFDTSKSFTAVEMSAKQTRQAMRLLPAQITDVVTSLASGMPFYLVAIQQGGQLRDSFGGFGNVLKGVAALISPMAVAIGGLAAAGAAAYYSYDAFTGILMSMNRTLIETGNFAGVTSSQMAAMAENIAADVGTQKQASQALNAIVSSQALVGQSYEMIGQAAVAWSKATGASVDDVVKKFVALGENPAEAMVKLTREMNFLTMAQYEQVAALLEQGNKTEASRMLIEALANTMNQRAPEMREQVSLFADMWDILTTKISKTTEDLGKFIDKMITGGSTQDQYNAALKTYFDIMAQIEQLEVDPSLAPAELQTLYAQRDAQQQILAGLNERVVAQQKSAQAQAEQNALVQAGIALDKARSSARDYIKNLEEEYELIGLTNEARMVAIGTRKLEEMGFKTGSAELEKYLVKLREVAKNTAVRTAQIEASKKAEQQAKKEAEEYRKMIDSADKMVEALAFETRALEMTNDERELAIQLRRLEALGIKEGTDLYAKYAQTIMDTMAANQSIKDRLEAEKKFQKDRLKQEEDYAKQVEQINNQIGQSLTDALMNGGMNAKEFLINMFKTLVLRPVLQPIITGMVSAAGVGASGAALAGGDGGMSTASMFSIGSSLKSAYNLVTSGFAEVGAMASTLASTFEVASTYGTSLLSQQTAMLAAQEAGMTAFSAAAGTAATALAGAAAGFAAGEFISGGKSLIGGNSMWTTGGGTAIGAAIGSIVPGIGTAIGAAVGGIVGGIVNAAFGSGKKEYTDSGIRGQLNAMGADLQEYQKWKKAGGWFSSTKRGTEFDPISAELQQGLDDALGNIGIGVAFLAGSLKQPIDAISSYSRAINISFKDLSEAEITAAIEGEIKAFETGLIEAVIPSIRQFAYANEEVGTTLQRLSNSMTVFNQTIDMLGFKMFDVSLIAADMASSVINMFGGQEKFVAATSAYYDKFYSAQEKVNYQTEQLTSVFDALNLALPDTHQQFRALVDAAQMAGDYKTFSTLVQLAPAFDALQTAMAELGNTAIRTATDIANEREKLETQLMQAIGNTAGLRQRELDALDSSNSALQQQIWAIEDARKAIDDAMAALSKSVEEERKQALGRLQTENKAVMESLEAQKNASQIAADVSRNSVKTLQSLFDYIGSQVEQINREVDSSRMAAAGMQFISQALVAAQTTGYLPTQDEISSAITSARAGLGSQNFATSFEMRRANLQLAGKLTLLNELTGDQLTTAERQLETAGTTLEKIEEQIAQQKELYDAEVDRTNEYYDQILEDAQAQIDALNGVNTSVLSVQQAVTGVAAAIAQLAAAMQTARTMSSGFSGGGGGGGGGGTSTRQQEITKLYEDILERSPDPDGLAYWINTGDSIAKIASDIAISTENRTQEITRIYEEILGRAPDPSGLAYWLNDTTNLDAVRSNIQLSEEARNLRGFANGGYYSGGMALVGERGPELINFAEPGMVYSNSQLQSAMSGNGDLSSEIRALREENRAQSRAMVVMQTRMTKLLEQWDGDGLPEERMVDA